MPWPVLDMTTQMMFRNTKIEELHGKWKQDSLHNAVEDAYGFAYERSHRILDGTESLDLITPCESLDIVTVNIRVKKSSQFVFVV
jgi:hypothetical protein